MDSIKDVHHFLSLTDFPSNLVWLWVGPVLGTNNLVGPIPLSTTTGMNSELFFSWAGCHMKVKVPV